MKGFALITDCVQTWRDEISHDSDQHSSSQPRHNSVSAVQQFFYTGDTVMQQSFSFNTIIGAETVHQKTWNTENMLCTTTLQCT